MAFATDFSKCELPIIESIVANLDVLVIDEAQKIEHIGIALKLIAFQIGNQVSTKEIGKQLGLDNKTIQRYLDLLEKSFVLVPLHGFGNQKCGNCQF